MGFVITFIELVSEAENTCSLLTFPLIFRGFHFPIPWFPLPLALFSTQVHFPLYPPYIGSLQVGGLTLAGFSVLMLRSLSDYGMEKDATSYIVVGMVTGIFTFVTG